MQHHFGIRFWKTFALVTLLLDDCLLFCLTWRYLLKKKIERGVVQKLAALLYIWS